jgi:hypothetical protein
MNTQNQPAESLGYYPSEYITGRESNIPRSTAEFCLKEQTIAEFWREAVKAIRRKSDGDVDGIVYTSDGIDVFLGPWDIDIRHDYKWTDMPGGYTYMGIWEPYAELEESFEVVGAYDCDNDVELHGLVRVLNQYYKDHENILLNR